MILLRSTDECPYGCDCTGDTRYIKCINRTDIPEFSSRLEISKLDITDSFIPILDTSGFQYFAFLTTLRIINCNISFFRVVDTWDLTYLIRLDISSNKLTDILSETVSNCPDLLDLNLTNNPLVDLKPWRTVLVSDSLMYLTMRNCQLTKFSKLSFSKLPNLVYLDLNDNKLTSLGGVPILNIVPRLVMLGLGNNNNWNCRNLNLQLQNCSSIQPSMRCLNEDGNVEIRKCKSKAEIKVTYTGIKRRYFANKWYDAFENLRDFYTKKYVRDATIYRKKGY